MLRVPGVLLGVLGAVAGGVGVLLLGALLLWVPGLLGCCWGCWVLLGCCWGVGVLLLGLLLLWVLAVVGGVGCCCWGCCCYGCCCNGCWVLLGCWGFWGVAAMGAGCCWGCCCYGYQGCWGAVGGAVSEAVGVLLLWVLGVGVLLGVLSVGLLVSGCCCWGCSCYGCWYWGCWCRYWGCWCR